MPTRSWRQYSAPIIAEVISCCGYPKGCDLAFVKKAISATYPFGERKYWPYKVWLDEVHRQLRDVSREKADARQLTLPTEPLTPDGAA